MTSRAKVVKVRSVRELPRVVKAGTYVIGSGRDRVRLVLKEDLSRDEVADLIEGIKELHKEYYG